MNTGKRVVIHVGVHKTGTTALQGFLDLHRARLRGAGVDFFTGAYMPGNHAELHAAAMRAERDSPFKQARGIVADGAFRAETAARVGDYIGRSPCGCVVFSAEGLSYLRHGDEMEALRGMIPGGRAEIVMMVREAAGFLASYRRELEKHPLPEVPDRESYACTGEDSWLVDYETRLALWREVFGPANVTVIDYDAEMRGAGNVIPAFLRVLGVEGEFRKEEWAEFFMNRAEG